jgi:hypothetical protein
MRLYRCYIRKKAVVQGRSSEKEEIPALTAMRQFNNNPSLLPRTRLLASHNGSTFNRVIKRGKHEPQCRRGSNNNGIGGT